jgi:N-glycosylase/DNA lyase
VIRVLGLNDDIEKINLEINKDSIVSRAIEKGKGLRVVEDGEWIATISFILSIASNIALIKKRIENFSKIFGKKIRYKDEQLYLFPLKEEVLKKDFEKLITKETFGFRYKFLINAIKGTKPNGIGPKVAACIALYGKHRLDEFPIDTWIKKVLMIYYPQLYDKNYKKMEKKAKEHFGKYAGYAQLYLYNFIRNQTSTTK